MKIIALAINTFREAIRDKVLYSLIFFAVLMIGISVILDNLTIGEPTKIIKDFGLASIEIFGVLIAIFVGIGLVYKEMEHKTIYNILSKPVHRYQFIIGKYFGLVLTLLVEVVTMSIALFAILYFYEGKISFTLLPAIGMIFLALMIITAFALLFSSFSTPILSGLFTLSFFIIGHLTPDLLELGKKAESQSLHYLTKVLYYVIPNLEYFNIKGQVVYHAPLKEGYLYLASLYGILYISAILLISIVIFQRRDIK
ncbi:MAG TPA: ABC transporter permease [Thermodesulfobacteriota bacterium]|nr:ABC transporter permease [Thermodesulfobacteriota bacterium]